MQYSMVKEPKFKWKFAVPELLNLVFAQTVASALILAAHTVYVTRSFYIRYDGKPLQ